MIYNKLFVFLLHFNKVTSWKLTAMTRKLFYVNSKNGEDALNIGGRNSIQHSRV